MEEIEFDQSQMRPNLFQGEKVFGSPNKQNSGSRSRHFPYREIELYLLHLSHARDISRQDD